MSTIKINVANLQPAAHAWQQRELKKIQAKQEEMVYNHRTSWLCPFVHWFKWPSKFQAMQYLDNNSIPWAMQRVYMEDVQKYYTTIRLACLHAEDNIVTLDIEDVYKLFGEN